jgi:3-methyladenine DNA glycosylase AlkC
MNLLDEKIETLIHTAVVESFLQGENDLAIRGISMALEAMYAAIPEEKRISYGRYTTIKLLAERLYDDFKAVHLSTLETGAMITTRSEDHRVMGVGLGILSYYGMADYVSVLPYFEAAAKADHWEPREYAQGLFRKIIKKHPEAIREYLLQIVLSEDPNVRRFVSETLRPVVENQWLYKDIDYSLSILRSLFKESHPYPRTSVGNNLSDIARRKPELVYDLVDELVAMKDVNATWIATRACRNLVKANPIRVMDLLGVDEYKYKQRVYNRSDYL